ncbi:MAG: glycosyl hydrolase 53 family protein [Flavicella sp.]
MKLFLTNVKYFAITVFLNYFAMIFCVAQTTSSIIFEINGMPVGFPQQSTIGLLSDGEPNGKGRFKVALYDTTTYDPENKNESFIYGFYARENTGGGYDNIPFETTTSRVKWWKDLLPTLYLDTTTYDNSPLSNSITILRNAISSFYRLEADAMKNCSHLLNCYEKKFDSSYKGHPIYIEVTAENGAALEDIVCLNFDTVLGNIPGEVFHRNGPDLTIQIFRDGTLFETHELFRDQLSTELKLDLIAADSLVFSSIHSNFRIHGLPEIWLARTGGESYYYCTPSIAPDTFRPFIGFDYQLHSSTNQGVALRRYPDGFKIKTPGIQLNSVTGLYEWYWIAQRRMDASLDTYEPLQKFYRYKFASDLGLSAFELGASSTTPMQRNNKWEAYNMFLLQSWEDPLFRFHNGVPYFLASEANELVYINGKDAVFQSGDKQIPNSLLYNPIDSWKVTYPSQELTAVNELVTAYQKNKTFLNGVSVLSVPDYKGYEIEDIDTYKAPSSVAYKACNGKPCLNYEFSQKGNVKAPGAIIFSFEDIEGVHQIPFFIDLKSPQGVDYGFYSSIGGYLDTWPSTSSILPYSFYGLHGMTDAQKNGLSMDYTYEDDLGLLTTETRFFNSENTTDTNDGTWHELFEIKEKGYHEITVYYNGSHEVPQTNTQHSCRTRVPIAGKELIDCSLENINVRKINNRDVVSFFEMYSKEGVNTSFLTKSNRYNTKLYSKSSGKKIINSYTFSKGDEVTFGVDESKPHVFLKEYEKIEWELSERYLSKRMVYNDFMYSSFVWKLKGRDQPYVYEELTGPFFKVKLHKPGVYTLEVSYRDGKKIFSEITVVDRPYTKEANLTKGDIVVRDMTPLEKQWAEEFLDVDLSSTTTKLAEVTNIFSEYSYVDGPRIQKSEYEITDTCELQNDFNASFLWQDGDRELSPSYVFHDPREEWFPSIWTRYTTESNISDDLSNTDEVIVSSPSEISTVLHAETAINSPIETMHEFWQYPIPLVMPTNLNGYRLKKQQKVAVHLKRLFDPYIGAFSGEGNTNYMSDHSYRESNNLLKPSLLDTQREKYAFYNALQQGHILCFDSNSIKEGLSVYIDNGASNKNGDAIFIAGTEATKSPFVKGASMANVAVMRGMGTTWKMNAVESDPYDIIASYGANLVSLNLLMDPYDLQGYPYNYETLETVRNEMLAAKNAGLQVLLVLHYSDEYTGINHQLFPAKWTDYLEEGKNPATLVYNYTQQVLQVLDSDGIVPDYIQIGNETRSNLLLSERENQMPIPQLLFDLRLEATPQNLNLGLSGEVYWTRTTAILNAGFKAVKDFSPSIKTVLSIGDLASLEEVWLQKATTLTSFNRWGNYILQMEAIDIFGLSFGPILQTFASEEKLYQTIHDLFVDYGKETLLTHTAYPHSYVTTDSRENTLNSSNNWFYPTQTSPLLQGEWLSKLRENLQETLGGHGFIYTEPFWTGTDRVEFLEGLGSPWENLSFFDSEKNWYSNVFVNELHLDGGILGFFEPDFPKNPLIHLGFDGDLQDLSGNFVESTALPQSKINYINTEKKQGMSSFDFKEAVDLHIDYNGKFANRHTPEKSVAFWFFPKSNDNIQYLYDEGSNMNGIAVRLQSGKIQLAIISKNMYYPILVEKNITVNQWHHVAFVFDRGMFFCYLDGSEFERQTVPDLEYPSVGYPVMGRSYGNNAFNTQGMRFDGYIDDFLMYDRALSSLEVRSLTKYMDVAKWLFSEKGTNKTTDIPTISSISISPNPVSEVGSFSIDLKRSKPYPIYLKVFGMMGMVQLEKRIPFSGEYHESIRVDVKSLLQRKGPFIVRLECEGTTMSKVVFVE